MVEETKIEEKPVEVKVDEDKPRSEKRIRKPTSVSWTDDFSIPKSKYGKGVLIMEFFKEAPIVASIFIMSGLFVGLVVGFFIGLFLGLVL